MWDKKKENLCVLCDIGSATVTASFVLFSEKEKPKILYTTMVPMSVLEKPDLTKLERLIAGYVTEVFDTLSHRGLVELKSKNIAVGSVRDVFVSLASPWFVSKTVARTIDEHNPFVFDEATALSSLKEEEKIFEEEVLSKGMPYDAGSDMRMIERKVIDVSLNGYPTNEPFGKTAKNAKLSIYMSLAPERILETVRTAAKNAFHGSRVAFHSFPLVSYGAVTELFPHERDYLFFDIAGEFSHMFMTNHSTITGSAFFPIGRNSLLREAGSGAESVEIAASTLALAQDGAMNTETHNATANILQGFADTWIAECEKSLQTLGVGPIPKTWFVIADEAIQTYFVLYLQSLAAKLNREVTIVSLDHSHLESHVTLGAHVAEDCFIALQAIYIKHSFVLQ